jgi:curved DNA-binding protein
MRSTISRDYYEVLGVSDTAGNTEIRTAFRNLARRFHPDVAENKPEAEERFKEINAAYEVLSDSEKRREYRNHRPAFFRGGESHRSHRSNPIQTERQEWDPVETGRERRRDFPDFFDWICKLERHRADRSRSHATLGPGTGRNEPPADESDMEVFISLEEVGRGAVRVVSICQTVSCEDCGGSGRQDWHACHGCDGQGHVIESARYRVRIPAGAAEGQRLSLAEFGEKLDGNGEARDVKLFIRWSQHPVFRVERGSLHCDVHLSFRQAALGTPVFIPTLTGRVGVNIPPCVRDGQKLRLPGCGLPGLDGAKGDLYVVVRLPV